MKREDAFDLVKARLGDSATLAHCLACEQCMMALAERFGEDRESWGIAGLVHDLDLDECQGDPDRHAIVAAEVLMKQNTDEAIVHAVLAHNDKVARESLMDRALWVVDPTTGFITASALIRPSKSTRDLTVKSIKKRMKDKRFAAAVNRDQIRACAMEIDLELDEFLSICLQAMDSVRHLIGLDGASN